MDLNCDGVVTLDEFLESCCTDDAICRSLAAFESPFWPDTKPSPKCDGRSYLAIESGSAKGSRKSMTTVARNEGSPANFRGRKSPASHSVQFKEVIPLTTFSQPQHFHHQNYVTGEPVSYYQMTNEQRTSRSSPGWRNDQGAEQHGSVPGSPSLVRVRSWYATRTKRIAESSHWCELCLTEYR